MRAPVADEEIMHKSSTMLLFAFAPPLLADACKTGSPPRGKFLPQASL
jgi:hypothetical protein